MTGRAGAAMQAVRIQRGRWVHVWCPIGQRKMRVVGVWLLNSNQRERETSLPPDCLLGCIASKKQSTQRSATLLLPFYKAATGVRRERTRGCSQIEGIGNIHLFVVYVNHSLTVSECRLG